MARSTSGESVLTRAVRIFEAFTPDETVLSVTQIARRVDAIEPAGPLRRHANNTLRVLDCLPVRLHRTTGAARRECGAFR